MSKVAIITLQDFRNAVKFGVKVGVFHHRHWNKEKGYEVKEMPPRVVSKVGTKCFSLLTQKTDGSWQDQWVNWPKASQVTVRDNTVFFFEKDEKANIDILISEYWVIQDDKHSKKTNS